MTDGHNDMHEDDHDGETVIAGDAVHEAPSDYEFADDHGAAPADHTDDHGSLSADAAEASPARPRSLLPILAAVGGVLVLGGVAWWQFGAGSSSDTAFMPTTTAVAAASMPAPVVPASAAPAPVEPTPAPLAPAPPPVSPTTDSMAAVSPAPVIAPAPSTTALPTPATQNAMPDIKPADAVNAALPTKVMMPAPVPAPVIVASPTPVTPAPVLIPPSTSGTQNIQSLATRMDVLQKDVEHLTTQLGQMTNALAATAAPSGNQDIQHRLDALEQKINNLHHGDATSAPMPTSLIMAEEKPVTHHVVKHKPRAPKVVQVKIHKPIKTAASTPQPLAKPEDKWVLRSATPDQAWVSESNTSRDLKQVKVGDTLPTIGRVTAIHQNGDEWVVQGTRGSIQ